MKTSEKIRRIKAIAIQIEGHEARIDRIIDKRNGLEEERDKLVRSLTKADRELYAEKLAKYAR